MHGRKHAPTVELITRREAQAALRQGSSPELTPEEERLLRMRLAAPLPLSARLDQIATATDEEIEILAYEIEAYLRMKEMKEKKEKKEARARVAPARPRPAPPVLASTRTKEKILRALRKKS